MVKINYKCSSCGGRLSYKDNSSVLVCSFCNKTYDDFIKIDDINVNDLNKQINTNFYHCPKCGFNISFNDFVRYGSNTCYDCNSKLIKKDLFVGGVVPSCFDFVKVNSLYKKEIKFIKNYLPTEFLNPVFKLVWLNTSVYEGAIIVSGTSKLLNRKIEKKYIFGNLAIPNYKDISNMNKISFLLNKLNDSSQYLDDELKVLNFSNIDFSFEKNSDLKFIEKACLDNFKSKYKGVENIKINSSVNVKNNVYIPVYKSEIIYEGKCYSNMIISYNDSSDIFCLNFPKLSKKNNMLFLLKYYMLNFIFIIVKILFCVPILEVAYDFLFELENYLYFVISIFFILIVIFFPSKIINRIKKHKKVYLNEHIISDEEFYSKMVDEKNKIVWHI